MLCRTCSRYPRHVEEFDNEREFSLSLSCPAVARMLLARTKQVSFLEKQDEREEEMDDSFDCFLYSALSDCRKLMFRILQERKLDIRIRMGRILALAHDVQNRIDARRIFEIEGLLERYGGEKAGTRLDGKLRRYCIRPDTGADDRTGGTAQGTQMQRMRKLLLLLDELKHSMKCGRYRFEDTGKRCMEQASWNMKRCASDAVPSGTRLHRDIGDRRAWERRNRFQDGRI